MNDQPADLTQPIEPVADSGKSGNSARTPIIIGVSLVVAAVLGVGAYAGIKLAGGGPQAAEALPDSVVAYASIDIDPGAKQKIEAIRTMRKFPDLRKKIGIDEQDDVRKKLFDEAIKGTDCEDEISFDKDVEPWLGDRAAVGAADLGADEPSPVFALQVSDEKDARKGIETLRGCGAAGDQADDFSYGFNEGFLIISDGADNAQALIKDAAKGTLAEDKNFQKWTGQAGGDGIVSFYVSPKAAELLKDAVPAELSSQAGGMDAALEDFDGMAGALRFADSGLEVQVATGGGEELVDDGSLGDELTSLPKDTAIALGFGVPDKFASTLMDRLEDAFGGESDSLVAEAESQTGLDLPDDLQTLLGDAVLVALGGDAPESMQETSGPSDIPFGLKIIGDADEIEAVVAKVEERAGSKLADSGVVQASEDDAFVLASNDDFADALKKSGSLGDNENFSTVVPEAGDASFAFFLDFDSAWRTTVLNSIKDFGASSGTIDQAEANTEPLGALGVSGWRDDGVSHVLIKLTTD